MIQVLHLMTGVVLAVVTALPNLHMTYEKEQEALTKCLWKNVRSLDFEWTTPEDAGRMAAERCEPEARSYLDAYDLAELGELYEYSAEDIVEQFSEEAVEYAVLELAERRRGEPSQ